MDARTAIDKAINELSRNRSDRAQAWALVGIAEAVLVRNEPLDVSKWPQAGYTTDGGAFTKPPSTPQDAKPCNRCGCRHQLPEDQCRVITSTPQDAPQATYSPAQPRQVSQDQPAPERPAEPLIWSPPPLTRPTPHTHPRPLHITTPKANLGDNPKTER